MGAAASAGPNDVVLANKLAELDALLDDLASIDLGEVSADDTRAAVVRIETQRRRIDALGIAVVADIDRHGLHRRDGFRSTTAFVKHRCMLPAGEAARRARFARAFRELPRCEAAYAAGSVGTGQLDVLTRVHANERVREFVPAAESKLLEDAQAAPFHEFRSLARAWERIVDVDGARRKSDRQHDRRDVFFSEGFDGSWHLQGRYGAEQGTAIAEVFQRYVDAERVADWEKARAELGDDATYDDLARSEPNRRADAWWAMAIEAAASPPDAQTPEPLVNIVMTDQIVMNELLRLVGCEDEIEDPAPDAYRTHRCSTLEGHHIDPRAGIIAAITGQLRRVVLDSKGVVIDLGRKGRLFTGSAREAALVADRECIITGCDRRGHRLQIDHNEEWQHGGVTDQANAGPICEWHNRWKSRHNIKVWRDPGGTWHTCRPDGSEIL